MHYRLGTLPLEPDLSSAHHHLLAQIRRIVLPASDSTERPGRDHLLRILNESSARAAAERHAAGKAPDLLLAAHEDLSWLEPMHEVLAGLIAKGRRLRLSHCEREAAISLAVVDESLGQSVRVNDHVYCGFAAHRGEDGGLAVLPRVYRVACENGAVIYSHDAEDVLHETDDIGEAVLACLQKDSFSARVERLRSAATMPVRDPASMLAAALGRISLQEIMNSREDDDSTVYGLLNTLTAFARRQRSFARRLEIERKAEDLLRHALLAAPEPARQRAALVPV